MLISETKREEGSWQLEAATSAVAYLSAKWAAGFSPFRELIEDI
jgi:hypothetical protein